MQRQLRAALIQLSVGKGLSKNIAHAFKMIREAKSKCAQLIVLPECFNSPYEAAKECDIYLVGGTIPEKVDDKIYNTCTVWDPKGEMILKYRKLHLYDVDIPGGITFKESDILTSGNKLQTFSISDNIKIGIAVCYDLRFEELAKLYRIMNCELIIYPGAFNMTTGPIHWELLQRARALDNQMYIFGVSPARSEKGYIAWGHSQVTNPWGKVIVQAGYVEEIIYCDLDFEECSTARKQLPVFSHRRTDVYNTILVNACRD
ncbi:omega-amidase NIT2-like [Agrilus planipennis]|uniref:omega-amidase n=1 Tax=Agrilus planipennis TaxID=224129 RepID=A0A1W4XCZ5_AGRPL|nr:omega-amidase NIT2-like [Agrilus planipennis]